jgi:hypothetical protein
MIDTKLANKQRSQLQFLINTVKSGWSSGKCKSWPAVFKTLGYDDRYVEMNFKPEQLARPLTFPELNKYLEELKVELEARISGGLLTFKEEAKIRKVIEPKPKDELTAGITRLIEKAATTGNEAGMAKEDYKISEKEPQTSEPKISDEELELSAKNNYGLIPSSNESSDLNLLWFQKKAIAELWQKIVVEKKSGVLLVLDAGYGKTFIMYGLVRRLVDANWFAGKTISHIKALYITPSTIIEQSDRVGKGYFHLHDGCDYELINIEVLRSKAGKFWIKEEMHIEAGEEVWTYKWKPMINPPIIFLDEAQKAKNASSTVTKIIHAYNDLPRNNTLVSFSATPFSTVSQAKYFAVSTHRPLGAAYGLPDGTVLNNENWAAYANIIASPGKPDDFNESAIERLMNDLADWIVEPKGIRPQFRPENTVEIRDFPDAASREYYNKAWARFLKEMEEIKKEIDPERYRMVILLKYAIAAEESKATLFVDEMMNDAKRGFAPACAVKFKSTVIKMVQEFERRGVSRNNISLVWGGGQTQLTVKQKAKQALKAKSKELAAGGIDIDELMEQMGLDKIEDRVLIDLPAHQRLGPQDLDERQKEIDAYQSGKATYVIYTFKAGGVGLSLPHMDDMVTDWNRNAAGFQEWFDKNNIQSLLDKGKLHPGRARRKESGYAYVEDIPFVTTKPRALCSSVTYSEMDMTQSLKRCARIVSLSVTKQRIYLWRGTIEMDIYGILMHKLKSLDKVTKTGGTNWLEVYAGADKSKYES